MAILPFPEWRPDVTPFTGTASAEIRNVVPRGDGYGPARALSPFSGALAAACRGIFQARNSDGTVTIFAGTSNKLWKLDNTDLGFDDVSKALGTYTALTTTTHVVPPALSEAKGACRGISPDTARPRHTA